MKHYEQRPIELTPQLFQPTMVRVEWSLSLLSHRDHSLIRWDAFVGSGDERIALGMGPWYGPQEVTALPLYTSRLVAKHIDAVLAYMAPPPEPFPEGA